MIWNYLLQSFWVELSQKGNASHKLKRSRLIGKKVERFVGSGNVSNMSQTDDSSQNVLSFCAGATTSAALRTICLTAFIYISRVPSCSLSLKDRGIPTFLGHHGNAAARNEERLREEEGRRRDEAGDVWTMLMLLHWSPIVYLLLLLLLRSCFPSLLSLALTVVLLSFSAGSKLSL